ncbi:hypothetical protein AAC387_Pa06g1130 [Persea americana]
MVTAVIQAPSSSSMTESTSSNSTSAAIQAARTVSDVFEPLDREATVGVEEAERLPSRFRTERVLTLVSWYLVLLGGFALNETVSDSVLDLMFSFAVSTFNTLFACFNLSITLE